MEKQDRQEEIEDANSKFQDKIFLYEFAKEWIEATNKLKQIHDVSKFRAETNIRSSIRVSSSSLIFR